MCADHDSEHDFAKIICPPDDFGFICACVGRAAGEKGVFRHNGVLRTAIFAALPKLDAARIEQLIRCLVNTGIVLRDDERCYFDHDRALEVGRCIKERVPIPPPVPRMRRLEELGNVTARKLRGNGGWAKLGDVANLTLPSSAPPVTGPADKVIGSDEIIRLRQEVTPAVGGLRIADSCNVVSPVAEGRSPSEPAPAKEGAGTKDLTVRVLPIEVLCTLPPREVDEYMRRLDHAIGRIREALDAALLLSNDRDRLIKTAEERLGALRNLQKALLERARAVQGLIDRYGEKIDVLMS